MTHFSVVPSPAMSPFVHSILVFTETDSLAAAALPFFADGFPGLLFHDATGGMRTMPQDKEMSPLFIYGQTLHPVTLHLEGAYTMIVFQLYPFSLPLLLDIDPAELHDACYDLFAEERGDAIAARLLTLSDWQDRLSALEGFVTERITRARQQFDPAIGRAISYILTHGGQVPIREAVVISCLSERTFERRFKRATGLTAGQFARIVRFRESLEGLQEGQHSKSGDAAHAHGFSDQSHFIRVFRSFTGETPGRFVGTE